MSFFGAMPFVINGDIPSVVDAMFETDSEFITTDMHLQTLINGRNFQKLSWSC